MNDQKNTGKLEPFVSETMLLFLPSNTPVNTKTDFYVFIESDLAPVEPAFNRAQDAAQLECFREAYSYLQTR